MHKVNFVVSYFYIGILFPEKIATITLAPKKMKVRIMVDLFSDTVQVTVSV